MYKAFEKWLNDVLEENMPIPGVALNFNLYEEGKRLMNLTYVHHMAWVGFTKSWYKMLVNKIQ